ncbi:hypothetical protein PG987_001705 [Apiospora arundinis]
MAVMKLLVFTLASLWLFELRNICPKPVPGAWGLDCSVWTTLNRQADPRGPEDYPVLQPRRWGNRGDSSHVATAIVQRKIGGPKQNLKGGRVYDLGLLDR